MQLTHLFATGLLAGTALAWPAHLRQSVDCAFSTTADNGATCESFAASWAMSVDELERLNPGLSCPDLDPNNEFCVIGTVTDNPITTTTPATTATVPSAISSTSTSASSTTTKASTTTAGNGVATPMPTQPGMVSNCNKFHYVASGVVCSQITSYQKISLEDFVKWNPTVGSDCRGMQAGVNVCVGLIGGNTPSTTTENPTTTTPAGNGIQTPQPIQPGMVTNCKKFHYVAKGVTCQQIISYNKITLADFVMWNNGVGSNCQTMWAETNVCVGV